MENEFIEIIRGALEGVMPQLQTLGALIVVDLGLGVAVAIKEKKFEFAELGRFFQASVVPKFIGWAVLKVGLATVVPDLGGDALPVSDTIVTGAWFILVADLGGDILNKIAALGLKVVERIPGIVNGSSRIEGVVATLEPYDGGG